MAEEEIVEELELEEEELEEEELEEEEEGEDFEALTNDLRFLLSALVPDIDIEAELENIAVKRDGSLTYVGAPASTPSKKKSSISRKSQRKPTPKPKHDVAAIIADARRQLAGT